MKTILLAITLLTITTSAQAAYILQCDTPTETVHHYILTWNGEEFTIDAPFTDNAGTRTIMDVTSIYKNDGTGNSGDLKACDEWGCCSTTPFGGSCPSAPSGVGLGK